MTKKFGTSKTSHPINFHEVVNLLLSLKDDTLRLSNKFDQFTTYDCQQCQKDIIKVFSIKMDSLIFRIEQHNRDQQLFCGGVENYTYEILREKIENLKDSSVDIEDILENIDDLIRYLGKK